MNGTELWRKRKLWKKIVLFFKGVVVLDGMKSFFPIVHVSFLEFHLSLGECWVLT